MDDKIRKIKTRTIYIIKKILPQAAVPYLLKISTLILMPFYSGNTCLCVCCKTKLKKFVGAMNKDSGLCPQCHSSSRHRFRQYYLEKHREEIRDDFIILHFAPESCASGFFNGLKLKKYIKADISSPFADERIDMTDIKYPEGTFDVILTSHVLEHIDDDIKGICELYRVLKKDGMAYVQIPQDTGRETTYEDKSIKTNRGREAHFGHIDHKRIYGRDFPRRLEQCGFNVETINSDEMLKGEEYCYYGINHNEIIYVCRK